MYHNEIIFPFSLCACVNIYASWLVVHSKFLLIRTDAPCSLSLSFIGILLRVCFPDIKTCFFQRLCVYFNMPLCCFLNTRQTNPFLRNNIAWGLYFKINLFLLVHIAGPLYRMSLSYLVCGRHVYNGDKSPIYATRS